jgi:hypothetical protein
MDDFLDTCTLVFVCAGRMSSYKQLCRRAFQGGAALGLVVGHTPHCMGPGSPVWVRGGLCSVVYAYGGQDTPQVARAWQVH